ncbi:MAG: peptidoglycan DD-metalloendopeptidase family protein [Burkholderiaceae bacterium]|nr:peptidoglycan DD-metalloendopeptidase family protein [Burkholderiaceae bacterium]
MKIRRALIMAATVAGVAACASRGPAPVEPRTRPVPEAQRPPVAAPVAPSAPAPAVQAAPPAATASSAPTIQSIPVRPSSVESRSLGGPEPRAVVPPSLVRSEPRGTKLPYSEAALAELRASAPAARPEAPTGEPRAEPAAPAAASAPTATGSSPPATVAAAQGTSPERPSDTPSFAWPARGRILQGFADPGNMGISIAGNLGEPISAAADGRVIFSGNGPRGYGNLVIVKHDADTLSVYAHNRTLLVKEGETVTRGQRIAELGDSGTDRPKLHFEIRKSGKPVDPQKFLPAR